MSTHCAGDFGLVLSMEEINNDRPVTETVVLPGLGSHHHVRSAITVLQFHVWLVCHPVEILVKTVQEDREELKNKIRTFVFCIVLFLTS